jgi:hypothetical protein
MRSGVAAFPPALIAKPFSVASRVSFHDRQHVHRRQALLAVGQRSEPHACGDPALAILVTVNRTTASSKAISECRVDGSAVIPCTSRAQM